MDDEASGDQRAHDGVVHLQAAALELIAAARAFLDVAEGLAREPGAVAAVVDAAVAAVRSAAPAGRPEATREDTDGGEQPPGVTRIRLS